MMSRADALNCCAESRTSLIHRDALFHKIKGSDGKMDETEASIFAVSVRTRRKLFAL